MTTRRRVAGLVVFALALMLTTVSACRSRSQEVGPEVYPPTTPFLGDSTMDSALYQYARAQNYHLITDSGFIRTDSAGVVGTLDFCVEQGLTEVPYSAFGDGTWRALGCVIRNGPVVADYPYLEKGLSLILVRRYGGNWQARILSLTGNLTRRMFVSAGNTRATLGADGRRFLEGPRTYACYTCDRKACCPGNLASITNPTQAQADVDHIATIW